MSKKLFLLFICAAFIAVMGVGCKGKRSVRVVVEHNYTWSMEMIQGDSKLPVISDNETRTYPLGDFKDKIIVDAWKTNTQTARIYVKIIEDFEPGFLYLASSEVKHEVSEDDINTHIVAYYDFGKDEDEDK
ncbi:MAG: hypothetical protein BWY84_01025 [Candidatus Aerophobetes bacterium ADurb.Bin490]|nr:MAG: hypothetical protein BWY84_01025 [Candidatus Aerophobetes bacterium ADurb.Bin490]HNZ30064.1 hypothetical protein [Candidatus Goldiibacteriota bacterium]HPI03783.1 hypothetical protein [Candidatus Goldiibacteriota bacterium]HPN65214.1 hypothetical protein [Candidatus Goldiibacteriota bacterium]HRQ43546.1 hypothetical protein [Candidatus Goldiibacteriota bacterium]